MGLGTWIGEFMFSNESESINLHRAPLLGRFCLGIDRGQCPDSLHLYKFGNK